MSAVPLARCHSLLAGRRNSLALLAAWQTWRRDGAIPRSADVRPEDLGRALAGVSILEAHAPDRLIYRLFGGVPTAIGGADLKGMNLMDVMARPGPDEANDRMWRLARTPCGGIYALSLARRRDKPTPICGVVLPVSPNDPVEPMLLYTSVDRLAVPGRRATEPASRMNRPSEFTFIDIGYGVPV